MSEWIAAAARGLGEYVLGDTFAYNPVFLLTSCGIAMLYWRATRSNGSMLPFIFPKGLYSHRSTRVDIAMMVFNSLFIGLGGLSFGILAPTVASVTMLLLNGQLSDSQTAMMGPISAAAFVLVLVLIEDFCRYAIHFIHHKVPVIWPFHAVHHSAEVLTPITFFRAHPVYFYLQQCLIGMVVGAAQGVFAALALGFIPSWTFAAAALVSRTYMLTGVHLRHSHIQLSYGRALEHVLISPRLHQVHHSAERRHYDRNFGEIFALWDWFFGTLYIPKTREQYDFGLTDENGAKIQPFPTIGAALLRPFAQSAKAVRMFYWGKAQPTSQSSGEAA